MAAVNIASAIGRFILGGCLEITSRHVVKGRELNQLLDVSILGEAGNQTRAHLISVGKSLVCITITSNKTTCLVQSPNL